MSFSHWDLGIRVQGGKQNIEEIFHGCCTFDKFDMRDF